MSKTKITSKDLAHFTRLINYGRRAARVHATDLPFQTYSTYLTAVLKRLMQKGMAFLDYV